MLTNNKNIFNIFKLYRLNKTETQILLDEKLYFKIQVKIFIFNFRMEFHFRHVSFSYFKVIAGFRNIQIFICCTSEVLMSFVTVIFLIYIFFVVQSFPFRFFFRYCSIFQKAIFKNLCSKHLTVLKFPVSFQF